MDEYGFGSRGPGVQLLQLGLSRAGYQPGRIDGSFGRGTENALRQFQQAQGLPATGRSDVATWQAMMPWLIGTRFVQLRQGDTFWRLSQQYDTSVAAISAANPELDPRDLRPGQTVAIPLGFPVVPTGIAFTSQVLELTLTGLLLRYPYLGSGAIGSSARGLPIWSVSIGEGETQVFYNAAHHANEWITTPVLLAFLEEYCLALLDGDTLYGYDAAELFRRTTLSIVPMVDPDGVDLVNKDDAGGFFFSLFEQVAYAGSSHADKHFNEVRSRHGEERHVCLSCHGFCHQGFTGSRRANQQGSLRNFTSQFGVFIRGFEERYNLFHLLFGLC